MLIHDGAPSYGALIEIVVDPERRALVFHCSHGVHRTGTGAAILLSLLGVPWETVRGDYLLSNTYRRAEALHGLDRIRTLAAEKSGVPPAEIDMTNADAFMIQEGNYIDASRDEVMSRFGSFDRYAEEALHIDVSVVNELQDTLLT